MSSVWVYDRAGGNCMKYIMCTLRVAICQKACSQRVAHTKPNLAKHDEALTVMSTVSLQQHLLATYLARPAYFVWLWGSLYLFIQQAVQNEVKVHAQTAKPAERSSMAIWQSGQHHKTLQLTMLCDHRQDQDKVRSDLFTAQAAKTRAESKAAQARHLSDARSATP